MQSGSISFLRQSLSHCLGAKRGVLAPCTYAPPLGHEFVESDGDPCFRVLNWNSNLISKLKFDFKIQERQAASDIKRKVSDLLQHRRGRRHAGRKIHPLPYLVVSENFWTHNDLMKIISWAFVYHDKMLCSFWWLEFGRCRKISGGMTWARWFVGLSFITIRCCTSFHCFN